VGLANALVPDMISLGSNLLNTPGQGISFWKGIGRNELETALYHIASDGYWLALPV
jgi:hypothetical protein